MKSMIGALVIADDSPRSSPRSTPSEELVKKFPVFLIVGKLPPIPGIYVDYSVIRDDGKQGSLRVKANFEDDQYWRRLF